MPRASALTLRQAGMRKKRGEGGPDVDSCGWGQSRQHGLPAPYSRQGNKQCERVRWRGKEEEETEKAESRRQKSWGSDCESRAPLAAGLK
jgi:hypothetical protein